MDEIATAIGRTGEHFAFQYSGCIDPDLICISKSLGAGYVNIGAVLVHERVAEVIQRGNISLLGHTYNGNPIACAVGLKVLEIYEAQKLKKKNRENGTYLIDCLRAICKKSPYLSEVRGKGMLVGIDISLDEIRHCESHSISKSVCDVLKQKGILTLHGYRTLDGHKNDHILIAPPFIFSREHIDYLVSTIEEVFLNFDKYVISS